MSESEQTSMSFRLIVVGKTDTGKSSTCNTLVGRQIFTVDGCANAVTTSCQSAKNDVMALTIVDTPGLFDSEASLRERALEIQKSFLEICKEPHAFLLVFKMGRITNDDKMTIALLGIIFGMNVFEHSIVILTHGCNNCERHGSPNSELCQGSDEYVNEQCENQNELESFWRKNETLSELVEKCNRRVVRIENDVRVQCSSHTTTKMFDRLISYVKMVSNNGKVVFKNNLINTHRQTLEEQTANYDNLQEQIMNLQKTLNKKFKRAAEAEERNRENERIRTEERERIRNEERERNERERERNERERQNMRNIIQMIERERIKRKNTTVVTTITLVSAFGLMAGAGAIGGVGCVVLGGPVGALVGLVIGKFWSRKQKQN